MRADPNEILDFWLYEVKSERWYVQEDDLDAEISHRFRMAWQSGRAGAYDTWILKPDTALALMILLDQFPRNMFRGQPEAFSSDAKALAQAKRALVMGHDLRVAEPERQFFYLPLMHSECLTDQDRCVRLIATRMPETGDKNLPHAQVHREIVRKFGRFPGRNDALGRQHVGEEQVFLTDGGYAKMLTSLPA